MEKIQSFFLAFILLGYYLLKGQCFFEYIINLQSDYFFFCSVLFVQTCNLYNAIYGLLLFIFSWSKCISCYDSAGLKIQVHLKKLLALQTAIYSKKLPVMRCFSFLFRRKLNSRTLGSDVLDDGKLLNCVLHLICIHIFWKLLIGTTYKQSSQVSTMLIYIPTRSYELPPMILVQSTKLGRVDLV